MRFHLVTQSQGIVRDKPHPVLTRKDLMGAFEIAFYGWKEGAEHRFYGPKNAAGGTDKRRIGAVCQGSGDAPPPHRLRP